MLLKEKVRLLAYLNDQIDKACKEKKEKFDGEEQIGYLEGVLTAQEVITKVMWDIIEQK